MPAKNKKKAKKKTVKKRSPLSSPKVRLFISEYLLSFNATEAAIRAKYSRKTAYSIGNENLNKPEIRAEINRKLRQQLEDKKVELESKLSDELEIIAFSDIMKPHPRSIQQMEYIQVEIKNKDGDIQEVVNKPKKIKLYPKTTAIDIFSKYLKLYNDTNPVININNPNNILITSELTGDLESIRKKQKNA